MALTNSQYDEIMRGYEKQQLENEYAKNMRRSQVYEALPVVEECDQQIAELSVAYAKKKLAGQEGTLDKLKGELASLRVRKAQALYEGGFPEDYLELHYVCPDCKDTGLVGGKRCHCLQQKIINMVYEQSNITQILERENFEHYDINVYSDREIDRDTSVGLTPREVAGHAYEVCRGFVEDFDNKPKNLLFYGETGVGKTFLTNCVAKELLDAGYSVIYFTAFQLFDILGKGVFEKDADAIAANQNIFDCDLLIIDDLGTELSNSFTTSQLFLCINERILRQKSTIISTNLSINQILDTYSERTFSRIASFYTSVHLLGDDLRFPGRRE